MAYWDFLQMTPENQAAARNMSWGQAIKSEIPGTTNYRGYSPFYKGADATGLGGYLKQGGQSLAGNFQAGSNVGGATPLMRKLAMSPVTRGIGTLGRFAGLTNPVGAAATAAYVTPKIIDALTERDPDATKSSLFGIDLTKQYPGKYTSDLNDWGSPMGPIPVAGDDIQEQVTETETIDPYTRRNMRDIAGEANLQELGTEHSIIAADKKRGFSLPTFALSGILKGLKNQFEYKGAENTAFDPNTGQYLTAEEQDKLNARGGWYSDAARYDRRQRKRVANMLHRRDVLKKNINDKRLEEMIKKGYGEDKTITPSPGPGTKGVYEEHGWTQPTYHDDSFTSPRDSESAFGGDFSGAGPSRHARGGRVRYSTGGRVGILSVF